MKALLYITSFLALAFAAALIGNQAMGRELTAAEISLAVLVVGAVAARWLLLVRRRQRQKVEEMRDSALW